MRRRPGFGEGGSIARGSLARVLEALRDIVPRAKLIKRGLRAGLAFGRLIAGSAGAREGLFHRRQPRKGLGARAFELRQGVAGGIRRRPRGADPPTPFRFRRGGFSGRAGGARRFDAQRGRRLTRRLGFPLEVAESILFHQATGGRSRRFGGGDEAVPAPQIAFERHEPLPGFELLGEPLALHASDHADLRQAPGERGRRGNAACKRIGSGRQRWILVGGRDQRPVRGRRLVDRGVEIVTQRGAKRRLIAARDADRVDRPRPWAARVGAEQARDRARLRLQPLRSAFGFSQRPATLRLDLTRLGVALFGRQSFALGGGERLGGLGDGLSARRAFGLLKTRRAEPSALALDSGIFRLQAREAPPLLFEGDDQRPATSGEVGRGGLGFRKRALSAGEATLSALLRFPRLSRVLVRPGSLLRQRSSPRLRAGP